MIRTGGPYAVVTIMVLCATLGAQSEQPSQSHLGASEKPPWLWTTEERIAKRVAPTDRAARRTRDLRRASAAPRFSPIDGSVEPELFLPVELVRTIVLNTDPPRTNSREMYRAAIASHGWDYDTFWDVLHSAAAPYISLMQQSAIRQRETEGRADLKQMSSQICAAQFDLLTAAYEKFGQQKFDEFLYTTVAPHLGLWISDSEDTADALRNRQRGCR